MVLVQEAGEDARSVSVSAESAFRMSMLSPNTSEKPSFMDPAWRWYTKSAPVCV